ncbi:MAG: hypothetical protein GY710_17590 [Desulfobacteraceae bacterium]|nr:hypothetical protein [Desulfobacteraceae bacterium]
MKQITMIIAFLLVGCFTMSCNSNIANKETRYSIITMTNEGAVVPMPIKTSTTIKGDLSILTYKNNEPFWSNKITEIEFKNLEDICNKNNILSQGDIKLKEGEKPIMGSRGMEFHIKSSNDQENIFRITGNAMGNIPGNVKELIQAIKTLSEKYKKEDIVQ